MLRVRKKKSTRRSDELLKTLTTVTVCSDADTTDAESNDTMAIPPLRGSLATPATTISPGRQVGGFASGLASGDSAGRAISQQHLHFPSGSGSRSVAGVSSRTPSYSIPTFDIPILTARTQFDSSSGSSSDGSGSGPDNEGEEGSLSARRRLMKVFPQQDFKYEALVDGVLRDRAMSDGSHKAKPTRAGGPGGIVVQFPEIQSNIASDGQPTTTAYSFTTDATPSSSSLVGTNGGGGERAIVPLSHPLTFVSKEGVAPDGSKTVYIEKVMFVTQRERERLIKDAAGLRARRRRGDRADAQKGGGVEKANRLLYVAPPTDGDSSSTGRSSSSMSAIDDVDEEAGALIEVQRALTVDTRHRPHERAPYTNGEDIRRMDSSNLTASRKHTTRKQEEKNTRIQERLAVTLLDPERNNRNQALRKDLHRLRVVSTRDVERHVATERHKQRLNERNLRQSLRETIAQSQHGLVQARVSGKTQIFAEKEREWRQQRGLNSDGAVFDGLVTSGGGLEKSLRLEQSGSQYTQHQLPHMQLGQALLPIGNNSSSPTDRGNSPVAPVGRKARVANHTTSFFFTQQLEDCNSEEDDNEPTVPDPELTTTLPSICKTKRRSPVVKKGGRHLTGPAEKSVAVRNPLLSYTNRNLSIWSDANARRSEMPQSLLTMVDTGRHKGGSMARRSTVSERSSTSQIVPLPPNRSSFGSKVVPPRLLPGLSQKSRHNVDSGGELHQETTSPDISSPWPTFGKITDSNNESPFSSSAPPPPFRSVEVVGSIKQKVLALHESRKRQKQNDSLMTLSQPPLMEEVSSCHRKDDPSPRDMVVPAANTSPNILSEEDALVVRTPSITTSNVSGFSASPEPTPIQPARRKSAHALTAFLPVLAAAMMLKKRRMSLSSQALQRESSVIEIPSHYDDARSPSPVLHNRARRETVAAPSPEVSDIQPSSTHLKAELSRSHLGLLSAKAQSIRSASSRSAIEQSEARHEAEALAHRQAEEHQMRDMARRFQPIYAADIFSREKIILFDKALSNMDRQKRRLDQRKNKRRRNSAAGGALLSPPTTSGGAFASTMLLPIVARRLSAGLPSPFPKKHSGHLSIGTTTTHQTTPVDSNHGDIDSRSDVSGDSKNDGGSTPNMHSSHYRPTAKHHGVDHIPLLLPNHPDMDDGVASMMSEEDNSISVASGAVSPSQGRHSTSTPTHGGSTTTHGGSHYTTKGSDSCIHIPQLYETAVPLSHHNNKSKSTVSKSKDMATNVSKVKSTSKKRISCDEKHNQQLAAEARERIRNFNLKRDAAVSESADVLQEEFRVAHIQRLQAAIRGAHDSKHRLETMHKALHRQEALRPLQGEKRRDALHGTGFNTNKSSSTSRATLLSSSVRREPRPKHPSEILDTVAKEAAHDFAEVGRLESHVARLEAVRPVLQYLRSTFLHPAAQEICRRAEELVADETLFVSPEEERQAQRRAGEDVNVAVTSTGTDGASAAQSSSLRPPTITVAKSAVPPRDPVEATVALISSIAVSQRSKTNKGVFLEKLVPIAEPHDLLSDDTLSVLTYCGMIFSASPAEVATVALQRAYPLVADHGAILESKLRGLTAANTTVV